MSIRRREFLGAIAALPAVPHDGGTGSLLPAAMSPFGKFVQPIPAATVVIDPGHGGHDPGCIGNHGTQEKRVVLDVALAMAEIMGGKGAVEPVLTREGDRFLEIAERVTVARRRGAVLLLSIHADSAPTPLARGASAYILSARATDGFAEAMAHRENGASTETVAGPVLTRQALRTSRLLQRRLIAELGSRVRILENPMRAADFAVLKSGEVPSVLLELGFLSNDRDERLLRDPLWRRDVAQVLASELAGFAIETAAAASAAQPG